MGSIDDIKASQARIARLQGALDRLLGGKMLSGLETSAGAGSSRVGYFKPELVELRTEISREEARLARLRGDRAGMRTAFHL